MPLPHVRQRQVIKSLFLLAAHLDYGACSRYFSVPQYDACLAVQDYFIENLDASVSVTVPILNSFRQYVTN